MKTFPIEQYQMTKHQTELKKLDRGEIQLPTILSARDPKIKINFILYQILITFYIPYLS